jgi:D-arabinose 1-dehydrogenase-like Zn-dependent alcohol dehydrogenase
VAAPANCATATVVCAARRVNLSADDSVVVLGCGMLGLTAVAYSRGLGVEHITACDVDTSHRQWAGSLGATVACGPNEVASAAKEYGADVIFELAAVQGAFDIVDIGGRIALVGSVSPGPEISFEPSRYIKNLTTVVGSHNYRLDDLAKAIDFLARTNSQQLLADLVPEPHRLHDIDAAVATARSGAAPRIAVNMR